MPKRRYTTKATREALYAASRFLGRSAEEELGLQIPLAVYLQDPKVAETDPEIALDASLMVRWEPGLADGPTSARFAVVDYNGDTGTLAPMATWDTDGEAFLDQRGRKLDLDNLEPLQFHQVNVWATLQRALEFYEHGWGLGRPVPYGFAGNRLIVVPHAGYGKNAYYDRTSKSLQFYYFDREGGERRVYTCLSADIVNHEFGHAMLDGVRPYFIESTLLETGAVHEYVADMTAILMCLRNNKFRKKLAETTQGKLGAAETVAGLAEEFGSAVSDKPYLRTALNTETMSDNSHSGPHKLSEVLTGAMFSILKGFADHYVAKDEASGAQAFWWAVQRMQRVALQPLDLLPPVDATFRDYALAVLRAEELTNPTDPDNHIERMLDEFIKREILSKEDREEKSERRYVYDRLDVKIFHDIDSISRSKSGAYAFLNDNRDDLFIPHDRDVFVADLYDSWKMTRQGRRLPRQIVLQYLWREDVQLKGSRFGEYDGSYTTMLCGGTLVFDENGTVLSWMRKPGPHGDATSRWGYEIARGRERLEAFLDHLAMRIRKGQVGAALGSSKGLLGSQIPTIAVSEEAGQLKFSMTPHMSLEGDDHDSFEGGRTWEVSS